MIFKRLDIRKVKAELEIERVAKERGELDLPPSNFSDFDEVENKIISSVTENYSSTIRNVHSELKLYKERLLALPLSVAKHKFDNLEIATKTKYTGAINSGKVSIASCKRDAFECQRELENFKEKNGIFDKTPRYPESRLFKWAVVFFVFMVESIANGTLFFSKGSDFGIIGGIGEAFIVSAMNVGVGFVVGWVVVRYINHKKILLKSFGIAGSLIYIVWLMPFNFFVAHYRQAIVGGANTQDATQMAFENLFTVSPTGLDLVSLLLILVGISFAAVGLYEGYSMDDPYPGYGFLARRFRCLESEYQESISDLSDEIQKIGQEAQRNMDFLVSELSGILNKVESIVRGKRILLNNLGDHLTYLNGSCNDLLQLYREENKKARKTASPEYFPKRWQFEDPAINQPVFDELESLISETAKSAKSMEQSMQSLGRKLLRALRDAHKNFRSIDDTGRGVQPHEKDPPQKEDA